MCAHEHACIHTPTPAPRRLSHFVTRECEKREYSASRTAPLLSPLIYGTSFSPCKEAKLTVGSLRVCVYYLSTTCHCPAETHKDHPMRYS